MFSESLLEFEESLAEMSVTPNCIMLNNLDLKADLNRFSVASTENVISEAEISTLFAQYDYKSDEVTLCPSCQAHVCESVAPCCLSFVEMMSQGCLSTLEMDFWHSFLDNPYKTLLALPNYSRVAFFQKGVPLQLRPVVWQKLILVNQKNLTGIPDEAKVLFKNFQHSYNRDVSSQIKKDLSRTFPQMRFFDEQTTVDALLTILNVYANYDLDLGYCQGLLFLVGTLYYQLRDQEATFHSLCKIMECEPELRAIFVPSTMSSMLEKWYGEFLAALAAVDGELAVHLTSFCDCKVFLYQWWLSVTLIHAPDFTVNNRIVDFCLVEGWKVGVFKISIGLLLCNRPILMSFSSGDEEVVYQHLLNESKWGNVINDATAFFGDMLFSMDESLFIESASDIVPQTLVTPRKKHAHKRTGSSVLGMLKNLAVSASSTPREETVHSASSFLSTDSLAPHENKSMSSLFSPAKDSESIYSNATSLSWDRHSKSGRKASFSDNGSIRTTMEDLSAENEALKSLLKRAYADLQDEALKRDISHAIGV
ncbi:hypothetical protein OXX80_006310 [Metschnikowia pulcherrima]